MERAPYAHDTAGGVGLGRHSVAGRTPADAPRGRHTRMLHSYLPGFGLSAAVVAAAFAAYVVVGDGGEGRPDAPAAGLGHDSGAFAVRLPAVPRSVDSEPGAAGGGERIAIARGFAPLFAGLDPSAGPGSRAVDTAPGALGNGGGVEGGDLRGRVGFGDLGGNELTPTPNTGVEPSPGRGDEESGNDGRGSGEPWGKRDKPRKLGKAARRGGHNGGHANNGHHGNGSGNRGHGSGKPARPPAPHPGGGSGRPARPPAPHAGGSGKPARPAAPHAGGSGKPARPPAPRAGGASGKPAKPEREAQARPDKPKPVKPTKDKRQAAPQPAPPPVPSATPAPGVPMGDEDCGPAGNGIGHAYGRCRAGGKSR